MRYTVNKIVVEAMQSYVLVYQKILTRALHATWEHRSLWILGFFAGLVQTGAVVNDLLRVTPKFAPGAITWSALETWWNTNTAVQTVLGTLFTGTFAQTVAIVTSVSILGVLGIALILTAQHLVLTQIHRHANRKKQRSLRAVGRDMRTLHLGRLFALNTLSRLFIAVVLLASTFILPSLLTVAPEATIYARLGLSLITIPLIFIINAIGMAAIIYVVRENTSVHQALQHATTFFAKHWLIVLEFSVLLFFINFIISLFFVAGIALLGTIVLTLFAFTSGVLPLVIAILALAGVAAVLLIMLTGGFMTTFNYAAWTELIEQYERLPLHPRSEHVAQQVHRAFSR